MTTDEKIDLLITRLTEKADNFYWCSTPNGWAIVMSDESGYRFYVDNTTIIHILTAFGETLIPDEDLNPPRNQLLRSTLTNKVAKLSQDRSELIDDLLDQLKSL